MKNKIVFVTLALLSFAVQASAPIDSDTKLQIPLEVGTPTWRINDKTLKTIISSLTTITYRWFYITNENNPNNTNNITIEVDGENLVFPIHPRGGSLIYGKNINLLQSKTSVGNSQGSWSIISPDKLPTIAFIWRVNPSIAANAIVAKFDTPREFLLSFSGVDNDPSTCTSGKMTVLIDGKPIDKIINTFDQGSSVIAKGKIVSVNATGSCPPNSSFYGTIQVLN